MVFQGYGAEGAPMLRMLTAMTCVVVANVKLRHKPTKLGGVQGSSSGTEVRCGPAQPVARRDWNVARIRANVRWQRSICARVDKRVSIVSIRKSAGSLIGSADNASALSQHSLALLLVGLVPA